MPERITIDALQPGMVILQVTEQNGPVKIRKSGLVSSFAMVDGLREMGVLEVEIDPAQTVEVETPTVTKSQTQQLLENDGRQQGTLDHALSEQFNRSLFLPSVQELPSIWWYYGRYLGVLALVVAGGISLGWTAATYSSWMPGLLSGNPPTVASKAPSTSANDDPIASEVATPEPAVTPETEEPSEIDPVQTVTEQASENLVVQQDGEVRVLGYQPDNVEEMLNQPTERQPPPAGVSPELLRRFEEAVAEVGDSTEQTYMTDDKAPADVPKVHELPAWMLTELPSMAFSAHMYASLPEERWIRVNGQRVIEGQPIDDNLYLVEIQPQHVILNFRGQDFSMAALTDW